MSLKNIEALHREIVISAPNYDSHLIKQELGNLNSKKTSYQNGLEKYMSFNINDTLIFIFIDSSQFLSFLFYILGKNDFKMILSF